MSNSTHRASPASAEPSEPQARPGTRLWAVSALFVVAVACAGYLWTGTPSALTGQAQASAGGAADGHDTGQAAQLTEMVNKLRDRMDKEPAVEGLIMLGRSYLALDRPAEAVAAYERARQMQPNHAGLLADMADALAVKNGHNLAGEPMKLVEQALRLEPNNLKALMLAGSEAYDRGAMPDALAYWQRMLSTGPADHPLVQQASQVVQQLQQQSQAASKAPPAAPTAASISGTVDLAGALKSSTAAEDAVFIFARPAEGSRMPLAILRLQVKDLPVRFTLDDSLAMSPQARLSSVQRVVVGARISKSGNAMAQPGDLEVLSEPMAVGAQNVKLEISQTVR